MSAKALMPDKHIHLKTKTETKESLSPGGKAAERSELRGGQGPGHVEGLGPGDDSREEPLKCFKQWMEGMWPYLCSSLWPLADPQ